MTRLRIPRTQAFQILIVVVCFAASAIMIRNALSYGPRLGADTLPTTLAVRRGMAIEEVRKIMGEPSSIATQEANGKLRQDWWYSTPAVQLTFIDGRLTSDHAKALSD